MDANFRSRPMWDIFEADWLAHKLNPRFSVYDPKTPRNPMDDVVFDKETGLVWERNPDSERKEGWDSLEDYSYQKIKAGRRGWRLPTIEELLSLVDPKRANPSLPAGHPFINVQLDYFYWSATPVASSPQACVWGCHFGNGDISKCLKNDKLYVWFVRGGSGGLCI